jgi:trimethylamine--corrinoid protein Co-methyltransferase
MAERLRILSQEQIKQVHEKSIQILEDVGVKFWEQSAMDILEKAGAIVDHKSSIVRFPRDLVLRSLKKAPREILLAGRNKKHDLVLGNGKSYFGTLGTAPLVFDLNTRERRYAVRKDLENFAHITDSLESLRYFHTSVTPTDMPTKVVDLHRWAIALNNTEKHCMGAAVYNIDNMPFLLEMLEEIAGGRTELEARPMITATECPVSPLQHDRRPLMGIMEFAKHKLPVIVYSEPKAGATAPASLAGTLVVSNCEVLSGITLMQVINPGAPAIYGSVATLMDMRTGAIAFGSPETGLLAAATTQMAQYYGIPNMTPGGRTDSKMTDEQAGYEKQRAALMAGLAGACLNNMGGLLESNLVASYEQIIIDDEIVGTIERILAGIDFDADALAIDLIKEVGPGGTYISKRHTLARLKKEHYMSRLSDRKQYSAWIREGSKQMNDRARERARAILKEHAPPPLDRSVDRRVQGIIKKAAKNKA